MKRLALLALVAAAACAPNPPPLTVPGPTTSTPTLEVTPRKGETAAIRSVVRRDPSSRVVAFRIAFASGSSDDPPGKEGLTRLTATTMTEGGTTLRTYAELVEKLYPMAASIEVHTDRDETVFSGEVAATALEAFYPLLKEVLLSPRLDASGFERMRARARSELTDDLRGASDETFVKEALAAAIYEGHPYGHPPVGTEGGLTASSVEDVRAQRSRAFCRERAVLGVAGNLPDGFERRLTQDFLALPACPGPRPELPVAKAPSAPRLLVVDKPTAETTAIALGFPVDFTRASPDFPALEFFADYLGLHRQSAGRLYHELRERRGFNYGDYAYAEYFEQESGTRFPMPNLVRRQEMLSLWLRPVKPKNAAFVLRGAEYVYGKTLDHGIPQAELDRFRAFLTRYVALGELTETRRLGHALDDVEYGGQGPYLDMLRDGWKRLDEGSLRAAVDRHLKGKSFVIAVVAHDGAALAEQLLAPGATPPVYDTPKPAEVTDEDKDMARYPLSLTKENVKVVKYTDLFR